MSDLWHEWKVADLCKAVQDERIPIAPLNTAEDVFNDPISANAGGFLYDFHRRPREPGVFAPGMPFKPSNFTTFKPALAPRLGDLCVVFEGGQCRYAAPAGRGQTPPVAQPGPAAPPLAGFRVLDFTWVWAGPYCTWQLAHLGADVMRVETDKAPGINRIIPPFADGKAGVNRAGSFNQWNQGKRSLQLDRQPAGVRMCLPVGGPLRRGGGKLRARSNHTDGIGYESLRKFNPDLVMLSVSGYGQYGPYRDYVSLGQQTAARAGMFWITGYPNDAPRQIGISYADPVAGVFGAFGIISALLHRNRTGQGQHIDLSMWETLEMMLAESIIEYEMTGRQPERMGNHDGWIAPHEAYKAAGKRGAMGHDCGA